VSVPARPLWARLKPLAFVLGVFLLGGVAGGAATRAYTMDELRPTIAPTDRVKFKVDTMRRDLDLSDDQARQIEEILRSVRSDRERVIKPCKPDLDELRESTHTRIHEVLNAKQRVRHDELHELMDHALKHGEHSQSGAHTHPSSVP